MSVVTSVPAFALKAVLGSRMAPIRFARSAKILPDRCILLVHGVPAGDERHHAARARLIERFGEEIIVNRTRNGRAAAISGIEHRIVAKRNVADDGIEEIVRQGRLFKSLGKDGRVRDRAAVRCVLSGCRVPRRFCGCQA